MYDSIIIGGGPAGMTAAIYLARKKMKIILLTQDWGGQTAKASDIENYPGIEKISGPELVEKFKKNFEDLAVETKEGEEIKSIEKIDSGFQAKTRDETFEGKTVIVCSGKTHRKLEVPGEEEFIGKGISYCAICDAPLFRDKKVVVIGGGNSALDAALEIEKHAEKVTILNIGTALQGDAILLDKFEKSSKSEVINNTKTMEIYGESFVKGIKYEDQQTKETKDLPCEGVFIEIGWTPSVSFIKDLVKLNNLGEIEVDKTSATSVAGIFAAGDVTDTPFKQIIIAAGDGAKAALSAWKYLISRPSVPPVQ